MSSTTCDDYDIICHYGDRAVNGVYSNTMDMAHTKKKTNPWIQIDLQQRSCVKAVKVWNRFDVTGDFQGQ